MKSQPVSLLGAHLKPCTWHSSQLLKLPSRWENDFSEHTQLQPSGLSWDWGFSEPSAFSCLVTEPSRKALANKGGPTTARHSYLNKSCLLPVGPNPVWYPTLQGVPQCLGCQGLSSVGWVSAGTEGTPCPQRGSFSTSESIDAELPQS